MFLDESTAAPRGSPRTLRRYIVHQRYTIIAALACGLVS